MHALMTYTYKETHPSNKIKR